MVVVYYINTYYLDAAIETIQSIKSKVELHILIELSPESRKSNIIEIEDLNGLNPIESCEKVLGNEKWKQLEKYFEGVASIAFVVHKFKRSFSFSSLKVDIITGKYINRINPDVVHFDSISTRVFGLSLYMRRKNVFITIHDPVPHSGEGSWKIKLVEYFFHHIAKGLFFYSEFASSQFKKYYPEIAVQRNVISFQPFSYITQFADKQKPTEKAILFFGRILIYKGVDLLLEAIPLVLKKYPEEKFIIAGNLFNCEIDLQLVKKHKDNISLITNHISIEDLAQLIENAKFIVCPYRDATQSGVLMTSYALGKMVIGSNVGAFPEYIQDNINGMLTEPNSIDIANKIIEALDNNRFKELEKNVTVLYSKEISNSNQQCILKAYQIR